MKKTVKPIVGHKFKMRNKEIAYILEYKKHKFLGDYRGVTDAANGWVSWYDDGHFDIYDDAYDLVRDLGPIAGRKK